MFANVFLMLNEDCGGENTIIFGHTNTLGSTSHFETYHQATLIQKKSAVKTTAGKQTFTGFILIHQSAIHQPPPNFALREKAPRLRRASDPASSAEK